MPQLKVTVKKLNKRTSPVTDFKDHSNIVGTNSEGHVFESVAEITNELGKWYKDADGYYSWEGGLAFNPTITERIFSDTTPVSQADLGWAFFETGGIGLVNFWKQHKLFGQGVRVAVLDTGINRSIRDIAGAIKDPDADVRSFINESVDDDQGHGTNCSSIVASRGEKLAGTAPQCELIIGKIRSRNAALQMETLLNALKWACEERAADIISLSISSPVFNKDIAGYILNAHTHFNKIFIASIGNAGEFALDSASYPSNYKGCISVGAFGPGRKIWADSSWNKELTLVAPGVQLFGYGLSGQKEILPPATSYACPFAAGILACLISDYKLKERSFSAEEFYTKLAFDQPTENAPLQYGKGIINPEKTLQNIQL